MAQHPLPVNFDVHAEGPPLKAWQDSVNVVHEVLRQHRREAGENLTTANDDDNAHNNITVHQAQAQKGAARAETSGASNRSQPKQGGDHREQKNRQAIDRPVRLSLQNAPSDGEKRCHRRGETRHFGRQSDDAPRAARGVCRQARRAMNAKLSLSKTETTPCLDEVHVAGP